jgi:GAF domain-containing protein
MDEKTRNYETLLAVTKEISMSKDPDVVVKLVVENMRKSLKTKGCVLFLLNRKTKELEVAAASGLSDEYLNKGPISALRSIAESMEQGPIAIYDVTDDPRIQYPEAARKEGIASILSVPMMVRDHPIGALRVYTATPWEFNMDDVNFVQALAQLAGMRIDLARVYKGMADSIDVLKTRVHEKS